MKAYELCQFGLDGLVCVDRPTPRPGVDEVLVRLRAVSLNYRDLLVIQGKYNPRMNLPRVPLSDGAGEITALGEGVTTWRVGDRVVIPFMPGWRGGPLTAEAASSALGGDVDGLLREYAVVPAKALLCVPSHLDFEQAAALPCAGVTAWNGLFAAGGLVAGQTLLLQGTGGVSLFGLQFGKIAGATTVVTSSSDAKLERARTMGADYTINYKAEPNWEKRVLEITGNRGVDLTLEVGGIGTLSKTFRATAFAGRISLIGVLSGVTGDVQIGNLLRKALTIHGIYVGSREMFEAMNTVVTKHELKPVIDRVFGFDDCRAALQHLESGQHFGKIVIHLPD